MQAQKAKSLKDGSSCGGGPLDNIWGSLALDYYGQPLYIYNQKS